MEAVTFTQLASEIRQCSDARDFDRARQIHRQVLKSKHLRQDDATYLANLLLEAYGRCGSVEEAQRLFQALPLPNVFSWNILLEAYAQNGHLDRARSLFDRIPDKNGIAPDEIAYIEILAACAHIGLLETSRQFFHSITADHGLVPSIEHYSCMIHILGRSGQARDAEELLQTMSLVPDSISWTALLGSSNEISRGARAARKAVDLDGEISAPSSSPTSP
ncbi:hypothetical protein SELMODRAFT_109709 [Selaginella moellendorffii]|uniref:Pentacotripeptide-repeat region of PRORP domain-containing protein n=1 Tax=Selaginella moellendorffii TaxID=88036 RepID=D8S6M1_SELML|nr:hypothetical protein SELMODRAFT_109709 [Selaginella moellendorffii]